MVTNLKNQNEPFPEDPRRSQVSREIVVIDWGSGHSESKCFAMKIPDDYVWNQQWRGYNTGNRPNSIIIDDKIK